MKTKVIAFRVTQEEFDLLQNYEDYLGNAGLSNLVYNALTDTIATAREVHLKQCKAFERKAKREAKKAAGNVSE